ncbi:MAG: hypothetical protein GX130_03450 [Candidatus Hydrogenedens sp.]|nr:hypothetical protein [Candidatus Hydrogenedens sp.]
MLDKVLLTLKKEDVLFNGGILMLSIFLALFYAAKSDRQRAHMWSVLSELEVNMSQEEVLDRLVEIPHVSLVGERLSPQEEGTDSICVAWPFTYRPMGHLEITFKDNQIISVYKQDADMGIRWEFPQNPVDELRNYMSPGYSAMNFNIVQTFLNLQAVAGIPRILNDLIRKRRHLTFGYYLRYAMYLAVALNLSAYHFG